MVSIRELRRDDFDVLFELSKRFFEEYERFEPEFFSVSDVTRDAVVAYFSRSFDSDDDACFVALEADVIVGYIVLSVKQRPAFYTIGSYGYISGLMVDPKVRGRGVASILDRARAWFSSRGVSHVVLETSDKNTQAISFYEKHGFCVLRTQLYTRL